MFTYSLERYVYGLRKPVVFLTSKPNLKKISVGNEIVNKGPN